MEYYKFVSGEIVVDVIKNPIWVKYNDDNLTVRSDVIDAMGVISSDMSSILHISGTKEFFDKSYSDVTAINIDKSEYESLRCDI